MFPAGFSKAAYMNDMASTSMTISDLSRLPAPFPESAGEDAGGWPLGHDLEQTSRAHGMGAVIVAGGGACRGSGREGLR